MFYFRNQVKQFVILFIERDGSTYLTSMLKTHPDIKADYERFAVLKQKGATGRQQLDWVESFFSAPLFGTKGAIGFKTKLVDILDRPGFLQLLQDRHCHIIQMTRNNLVKAVISRINARRLYEATGYWNLYKEEQRMEPLAVDLDEFDQFLNEREQAIKDLTEFTGSLQLPTLEIVYEELLVNKDGSLECIFEFLKIPPKSVESRPLKHTSDDLREAVSNFDELRTRYIGSKYEAMFNEVLVEE